jgi:hypothetical protein
VSTVLVLSFSDLGRDPRVNRQIRFLAARHEVVAAGFAPPGIDGVRFVDLRNPAPAKPVLTRARMLFQLLFSHPDAFYWSKRYVGDAAIGELEAVGAELVVANDILTLPLAFRIARGSGVLFDAHEYAPAELADDLAWRLLFSRHVARLCKEHIPRVAGMMTVCDGIADLYERDTGVRPVVVTNAPDYEPLAPSPRAPGDLRIRMVHHGNASRSRRIETMIRLLDSLDERFSLDLMLVGMTPGYERELRAFVSTRPSVRLLDPVPMRRLPAVLNAYDVGLYILAPTNLNNRLALPNKFFEFVQARLALAIGPSPEMARIVRERDLGVVADDFTPEAMARALAPLTPDAIERFKSNAENAARDLSADANRERVLDLADRVLGRGRNRS